MTNSRIKISPSILSADFGKLSSEIELLCQAGADYIHIDVMDGHFTNNITIGSPVVRGLKKYSTVPLDVHLMITNVEKQIDNFIDAGADILTFHHEATDKSLDLLKYIRSRKIKAGISIIPNTPAEALQNLISELDWILVMTVIPGYAGQKFMDSQLPKIRTIRNIVGERNISIAVDGGIDNHTGKLCTTAGANVLVSGSYIFKAENKNYRSRILKLRDLSPKCKH
jgi:ribulose-phosphate 3-epimerase